MLFYQPLFLVYLPDYLYDISSSAAGSCKPGAVPIFNYLQDISLLVCLLIERHFLSQQQSAKKIFANQLKKQGFFKIIDR